MFQELPWLVIEIIRDYLYPFRIHYLGFRLLSKDFRDFIDLVVNDTPSAESINFRIWSMLCHRNNPFLPENRLGSWKQKCSMNVGILSICGHDLIKTRYYISVFNLIGSKEIKLSITYLSDSIFFKQLFILNKKIHVVFSTFVIVFDYLIDKITINYYKNSEFLKEFYQFTNFISETVKNEQEWSTCLFNFNSYYFYMNNNQNNRYLMIDKISQSWKVIVLPESLQTSVVKFIWLNDQPMIHQHNKKTNTFVNMFPLEGLIFYYNCKRYSKIYYLGSNNDFDFFMNIQKIFAFSRYQTIYGQFNLKLKNHCGDINVLHDRLMYPILTKENKQFPIELKWFQWDDVSHQKIFQVQRKTIAFSN